MFIYQVDKYTMYNMTATKYYETFTDTNLYFESVSSDAIIAAFTTFWKSFQFNGTMFLTSRTDIDSQWRLAKFSHFDQNYIVILKNVLAGNFIWVAGSSMKTAPDPNGTFVLSQYKLETTNLVIYDVNGSKAKLYYTYNDSNNSNHPTFKIDQIEILSNSVTTTSLFMQDLISQTS